MRLALSRARGLPEVKEVYNTGLIPVQWYLFRKDVAPSNLCDVEASDGRLMGIRVLDDDEVIEPPPFKTVIFQTSDSPAIEEIMVYDEEQNPLSCFKGEEAQVLGDFRTFILEEDPDVIVTDSPITTARRTIHRAACNAVDFRFGRGGEMYHGRVLLGSSAYLDSGIAGLVERTRFTFAPMGVSADWEAGKTIDSRQCYDARARLFRIVVLNGFISLLTI